MPSKISLADEELQYLYVIFKELNYEFAILNPNTVKTDLEKAIVTKFTATFGTKYSKICFKTLHKYFVLKEAVHCRRPLFCQKLQIKRFVLNRTLI